MNPTEEKVNPADCDFSYYAIDKDRKLVYGFSSKPECLRYSKAYGYRVYTKKYVQTKMNIDIFNLDNWSNTFGELIE